MVLSTTLLRRLAMVAVMILLAKLCCAEVRFTSDMRQISIRSAPAWKCHMFDPAEGLYVKFGLKYFRDDPFLCKEGNYANKTHSKYLKDPVAVLARPGECSFETKAKLSSRIGRLLIIHDDRPTSSKFLDITPGTGDAGWNAACGISVDNNSGKQLIQALDHTRSQGKNHLSIHVNFKRDGKTPAPPLPGLWHVIAICGVAFFAVKARVHTHFARKLVDCASPAVQRYKRRGNYNKESPPPSN